MVTRRLVLIRHAKAADGLTDHERPLAERGRSQAPGIGRWLAANDVHPDRVVVSTARRTRETWALAATELGGSAGNPLEPEFDERIYDNDEDVLLEIVRETEPGADIVVLVGHSPSMPGLAIWLDPDSTASVPGRQVNTSFPTSAIAVLEVTTSWAELGPGAALITAMVTPADF